MVDRKANLDGAAQAVDAVHRLGRELVYSIETLEQVLSYLRASGNVAGQRRGQELLDQLRACQARVSVGDLLANWMAPTIPENGPGEGPRAESVIGPGTSDERPRDMLARIKGSVLGRFYRAYFRRFPAMRAMMLLLWRHLYPLYVNRVAPLIDRRAGGRRLPLVPLRGYAARHQLLVTELASEADVATPAPRVFPVAEQAELVSPHDHYRFPSLYVAELQGATVCGGTNLVLCGDVVVCHDLFQFSTDYTSEELHGRVVIDPTENTVQWLIQDASPATLPVAASFVDACAPNYAHWLTEVLPRVAVFCRDPAHLDVPLVVNEGLHPNLMESLRRVVGPDRGVLTLPIGRSIHVERLLLTSVVGYVPFERRAGSKGFHSHGQFSSVALSYLRQNLAAAAMPSASQNWPEKVYLKRNSGIRNVVNAEELELAMLEKGFVVVSPEQLTFLQQVCLFMNAKVIVGSSGAALANLVFSRVDARIYILIGKYPDTAYWYWQNMACAAGLSVQYILGTIVNRTSGIHSDFEIDVPGFVAALHAEESGK